MKIFKPLLLSLCIIIATPLYAESSQSSLKDSIITTTIKAKIALDSSISVFKIYVTTENKHVTLAGTVDTKSDIADLIKLAEGTDGVKSVTAADLKVKASKQPIQDLYISGKLMGLFLKEKYFGDHPDTFKSIDFETNDGVVYLTGTVKNPQDAVQAMKLVQGVSDIRRVVSKIAIQPT